jgi:hypothetical protein
LIDQPDASDVLCHQLEHSLIPKLKELNAAGVKGFLDYALAHTNRHILNGGLDAITYMAAGDRETALTICKQLIDRGAFDPNAPVIDEEAREVRRQRRELCRLIALDDRPAIAKMLHEQELASVTAWKMEKYWEEAPFPFQD